ncbi:MAG TPA: GTP-binding protein [Candidatus Latescibacteria bacterium]|nr:GTP-binding protein [Candidatus Handelsmanbacteria bacterium]HIL10266.1 GTP-binding protein [Candidatus Latescibacterota bacterium]
MDTLNFACAKCGHRDCDIGEIRTVGGFSSKIFDIQNRKFSTVIYNRYSHSEVDAADSSTLSNVFDLFTQ